MQCKRRTVSEKIAQEIRENVGGYFFFDFFLHLINLKEVFIVGHSIALFGRRIRIVTNED